MAPPRHDGRVASRLRRQDNSLVQRFIVDRCTGFIRQAMVRQSSWPKRITSNIRARAVMAASAPPRPRLTLTPIEPVP